MDEILKDKRFQHAVSDKRFRNVPYKDRRVKIDKRFKSLLDDKTRQVRYKVDEKGRPVTESKNGDYKKFYDLSSDESDSKSTAEGEESSSEGEESEGISKNISEKSDSDAKVRTTEEETSTTSKSVESKKSKLLETIKEINKFTDEEHKRKINNQIRGKLSNNKFDYARGDGALLSESSSDESSSDESVGAEIEHAWGEFDKDAEEIEEATKRLAVCNMDWDRVNANDLMVLFNSFLSSDGYIESVTIYPSEFGLARMAEEELKGPKELVEINKNENSVNNEKEEIEEGSAYQREKLREYQMKRLRYYFAIIVCNSTKTADSLYTECDGIEYESSAMKIDLRFVPDDVTFDEKPHDQCTLLPDLKKYKPRLFVNTALQQGKVDLTWDETDPNRVEFAKKLLNGKDIDENDLNAYVAASSSEGETDDENEVESNGESDDGEDSRIKKYRDLISNLKKSNSKIKGDVEMEVTWEAGSSTKGQSAIKSSDSEDGTQESEMDSQDEMKVPKNKKITKKYSKKEKRKREELSEDEDNDILDSEEEAMRNRKQKKLRKNKKGKIKEEEPTEEEKRNMAELELILADDNIEESGSKQLSYKETEKQEKMMKHKKKWKKRLEKMYNEEDNFEIPVNDERFSAIYTNPNYNIDPSHPEYKATKQMEKIIQEKVKRRKLE